MGHDDLTKGLKRLTDSGKLDMPAAREALRHPLEGVKLVMLDDLKRETDRQSLALFGDQHLPGGCNPGLVKDVREMRVIIFRAIWSITGVAGFCTFILTIVGIVIEMSKK